MEVFGVVAGAAGVVPLFVELKNGIKKIQYARENFDNAPVDLEDLAVELEFLVDIAEILVSRKDSISQTYPQGAKFLRHCVVRCEQVRDMLNTLSSRYFETASSKGGTRARRKFSFRGWQDDVGRLRDRIESAKKSLTLVCSLDIRSDVNRLLIVDTAPPPTAHDMVVSDGATQQAQVESASDSVYLGNFPERLRVRDCSLRPCSCSCHRRLQTSGRSWWLQYDPLAGLVSTCDNRHCTGSNFGFTLRLALSELGISWATVLQFQISGGTRSFSLRPTLWMERTVPYDAPAFEILYCDAMSNNSDPLQIKQELLFLYRADPTFTRHVDPAGRNYLEYLLDIQGIFYPGRKAEIFDLCMFLAKDCGLLARANPSRLLGYSFALNTRLCLSASPTKLLIDAGLDPLEANVVEAFQSYERTARWTLDWDREYIVHPLYPSDWKILCEIDSDGERLAGLHEAITKGSTTEEIEALVSESPIDERNSLGQTPLHMSAMHAPPMMEILVRAGHSLDLTDRFGVTPVQLLLGIVSFESEQPAFEAVAAAIKAADEMGTYDTVTISEMWAATAAAAIRKNKLEVALEGVESLRRAGFYHVAHLICLRGLDHYMDSDYTTLDGKSRFETEIAQLADLISSNQGNLTSTIHEDSVRYGINKSSDLSLKENKLRQKRLEAKLPERCKDYPVIIKALKLASHVQILIQKDFDLPGYVNPIKGNSLWEIDIPRSRKSGTEVLEGLLDCGVDPNHRDYQGDTYLHYLCMLFRDGSSHPLLLPMVSTLLRRGANPLLRNKCKCSCAPNGCLALLSYITSGSLRPRLGAILYLSLVEVYSPDAAPHVILALIRQTKHSLLGMTHVCRMSNDMNTEDIEDILEEEKDFTRVLDTEMNSLEGASLEDLIQLWFLEILKCQRRFQAEREQGVEQGLLGTLVQPPEADLTQEARKRLAEEICWYGFGLDFDFNPESWFASLKKEQCYLLLRSRMFRLMRVLGISEKLAENVYWELLREGWGDLPKKTLQRQVDRFMEGAFLLGRT